MAQDFQIRPAAGWGRHGMLGWLQSMLGGVTGDIQTQLDTKAATAALGVPRMHVHRNGTSQTGVGTSVTKMRWTTEVYDSSGSFAHDADDSGGATESRWTPLTEGYYANVAVLGFSVIADQDRLGVYLYKNGSEVFNVVTGASGTNTLRVWAAFPPIYMNGTTDYLEIFARNVDNSDTVSGGAEVTYWAGWWVGP